MDSDFEVSNELETHEKMMNFSEINMEFWSQKERERERDETSKEDERIRVKTSQLVPTWQSYCHPSSQPLGIGKLIAIQAASRYN